MSLITAQLPDLRAELLGPHCPGRKPPFLVVKRHAHPYKTAVQKQFTVENAKGT